MVHSNSLLNLFQGTSDVMPHDFRHRYIDLNK